jgi:chaperonin GroEL
MGHYSKHLDLTGSEELIAGIIKKYSDVVVSTMGPGANNAILQDERGVLSTMDGVTVLRRLRPREPFLRTLARLIIDASESTVEEVGDGTTTTACLLSAIYSEWVKMKEEYREVDKVSFFKGMNAAVDLIADYLDGVTKPIVGASGIDREALFNVAMITCNGDEVMASMMTELIYKAGVNGRIIIKRNLKNVTTTEHYAGYTFDTEPLGRQHMVDRAQRKEVLVDPLFIISADPLTDVAEVMPIMNSWTKSPELKDKNGKLRPLVILTSELVGGARSLISQNAERAPVYVVKPPFGGKPGYELMDDVRYMTGTRMVFWDNVGKKLTNYWGEGMESDGVSNDTTWMEFGSAKKCIITPEQCSIVPLDEFDPSPRIDLLNERINTTAKISELAYLKDRIAALDSGVGIVHVGAHSEAEYARVEHYIEDVHQACFTAFRGGVVPGAGRALFMASKFVAEEMALDKNLAADKENGMHQGYFKGIKLVLRAALYPSAQILANYNHWGLEESIKYLASLDEDELALSNLWNGWFANGDPARDLYAKGIIDPTLVCISTLRNATSVAKELIGCKYMIIEDKQPVVNGVSSSDEALPKEVDKNFIKEMYAVMDSYSK